MRKLLLLAVLALGLGLVPAQADPGNGCAAAPVADGEALSCSYTATGPAAWVAATPNHYTITVTHTDESGGTTTTVVVENESLTPPAQGTFDAAAGDVVTITVGPDDASPAPVNGSIGVVAAADQS